MNANRTGYKISKTIRERDYDQTIVFYCCLFIPLGFVLLAAPLMAAGRGWRAFLWAVAADVLLTGIFLGVNVAWNFSGDDRSAEWVALFAGLYLLLFLAMGGVVLYAKYAEGEMPGKVCRVCGYDLRASPERCPECGTPVKFDPDVF
jgi:hypothetical protein